MTDSHIDALERARKLAQSAYDQSKTLETDTALAGVYAQIAVAERLERVAAALEQQWDITGLGTQLISQEQARQQIGERAWPSYDH